MLRWVLTEWLEKAGSWDCVDAQRLSAARAETELVDLKARYGPPEVLLGNGGETVTLRWYDSGAKIELRQQPCS